jgi:K+-sensing histidine kinase KdpD
VLDMSKIEAGQLSLSLGDYSIQDMVQGVYVAVEPLAASKKIALKVEVAPDLPLGRGDERRLSQVLLNLVGNAIKFTDFGEVAIKVGASDSAFTVAVRDTGPRRRRRGRPVATTTCLNLTVRANCQRKFANAWGSSQSLIAAPPFVSCWH